MALEIERKFLIKELPWSLDSFKKKEILQWYFLDNEWVHSRLRKTISSSWNKSTTSYFFTQKQWTGLVRQEFETKVSKQEFETLWTKVTNSLEKTRYLIPYENHTIELDIFDWNLQWLTVAEVEFKNEENAKSFTAPNWFGKELTHMKQAINSYLAEHWFKDLYTILWQEDLLIKKDLAWFYDNQAKKYSETRKKHRSDAELILETIRGLWKKSIKLLEFGCWSWRLLAAIQNIYDIEIDYIGVDLSKELLGFAEKEITNRKNIRYTLLCDDVTHFIAGCKQEEFDIIIGIAAFQHIPSIKERFFLMKNFYRILVYEGVLFMTNWSLSQWFWKKHFKEIVLAIGKWILSFGNKSWRDILVPWKNKGTVFLRYYHLFGLRELNQLARRSGFIILNLCYLDKLWTKSQEVLKSNNSLLIVKKTIYEKN